MKQKSGSRSGTFHLSELSTGKRRRRPKKDNSMAQNHSDQQTSDSELDAIQASVDTAYNIRNTEIDMKKFEMDVIRSKAKLEIIDQESRAMDKIRSIADECGDLRVEIDKLEQQLMEIREKKHKEIMDIQVKSELEREEIEMEIAKMLETKLELEKSSRLQEAYIKSQMGYVEQDYTNIKQSLDYEIDELYKGIETEKAITFKNQLREENKRASCEESKEMLAIEIANSKEIVKQLEKEIKLQKVEQKKIEDEVQEMESKAKDLIEQLNKENERHKVLISQVEKVENEYWKEKISRIRKAYLNH